MPCGYELDRKLYFSTNKWVYVSTEVQAGGPGDKGLEWPRKRPVMDRPGAGRGGGVYVSTGVGLGGLRIGAGRTETDAYSS